MPLLTQADYVIGDLRVRYQAPHDRPDAWGLSILPAALTDRVVAPREHLEGPEIRGLPAPWNTVRAWECDPLVQVHVAGESLPGGYAQGRTLRHSQTTQSLVVREQVRESRGEAIVLRTTLVATSGLVCLHELTADPASHVTPATRSSTPGVIPADSRD